LIRAIRPHGHLYTFDFHKHRASVANIEFEKHGLNNFVTLKVKDICKEGFGEDLRYKVDAIFLDLPHPWLTIEHAIVVLKKTGKILLYIF